MNEMNRKSLQVKKVLILLLLSSLLGGSAFAEIKWFPPPKDTVDLRLSSNPNIACIEGSYGLNPIIIGGYEYGEVDATFTNRAPFIKLGYSFGLLDMKSNNTVSSILISGFIEMLRYSFLLWRGNIGVYYKNEMKLFSDKRNTDFICIGIAHESQHYTLETSYFDDIDSYYKYFPNDFHSFEYAEFKAYHQFEIERNKMVAGFGLRKYFSVGRDSEITRSFDSSISLELIYERLFESNSKQAFFVSLYYEDIRKNMQPYWQSLSGYESYWNWFNNSRSLSSIIMRIGITLKYGSTIQPYLMFMSSYGRGLDFLKKYDFIGVGLRILPGYEQER